jgi:Ca-activated chloride channel homolog
MSSKSSHTPSPVGLKVGALPILALLAFALVAPAVLSTSSSPAHAQVTPQAQRLDSGHTARSGSIHVEQDGVLWGLPLLDTHVDAEITGFVADVEVRQVFSNPFSKPIEAVYLFPLPDNAAVDDMVMQVGDRRIVGEIHKRAEARQIYERAKDNGQTAALLDQERPNLFTQHVANILPGERIDITIHFVQTLQYQDEGYEWAFPMVVGPRYIPAEGTGTSRPQDDAARLSAPYASSHTGSRIALQLSLDAGVPIQSLRSPSHKLLVQRTGDSFATVSIDQRDRIPNKDFVLRYDVAGEAPDAALLTHRSGLGGYFLLMLQPQAPDFLSDDVVTPKEMVFVVDTSCSMSGFPLDKAKDAMRLAIAEMNPQDRFTVLDFNDSVSGLSPLPLPNTSHNRAMGKRFVDSFRGSGGTQMLKGIKASLDLPTDEDMLRTVLFMTDGYIGNEEKILAAISERLGRSRLFSLGIGSSVNRFLLDRMSKMGRGQVQYLRPDEDATDAVQEFYERIRNPVMTDIEVEWQGVEVEQVMPDPVPDLFAGQPVILVGRYDKPGRGSVTIRGRVRGEEIEQTIDVLLPRHQDENSALASLWARTSIEDLESRQYGRPSKALTDEITELALEYRLMSKYTSFVAVEESRRAEGMGSPTTVRVPLESPEFVDIQAAGGHTIAKQRSIISKGIVRGSLARGNGNGLATPPAQRASEQSGGLMDKIGGAFRRGYANTKANTGAADNGARVVVPQSMAEPELEEFLVDELDSWGGELKAGRSVSELSPAPAPPSLQANTEEMWPGLNHRQILKQVEQALEAVQKRWERDSASYPNGGEWRLRLHVDRRGNVTRIDVLKDSLRHGALRKLLRTIEGALHLPLNRTDRAVQLNVVITFSSND